MEVKRITSRQNPMVRDAAELGKNPDKRRDEKKFLCEGARLCRDAAQSGLKIETCFFTEQARRKYAEYIEPVLAVCQTACQVEEHVASLLSDTRTTQGVFCVCRQPGAPQSVPRQNCLVLENMQDPGNLGTVLRTAEALGVSRVFLLGECCDPLSPKVLRASMGAVFRVTPVQAEGPRQLKDLLAGFGFRLHAAVPDASARKVTEIDFSQGLHSVFIGNEGNGLTEETVDLCHDRVTIPMAGRAESLNASAAATLLLWEMCRPAERKNAGEGGESHG